MKETDSSSEIEDKHIEILDQDRIWSVAFLADGKHFVSGAVTGRFGVGVRKMGKRWGHQCTQGVRFGKSQLRKMESGSLLERKVATF